MSLDPDKHTVELAGKVFDFEDGKWFVRDSRWFVEDEMSLEVLDYIKALEDDFLAITGCIAGVDTVLTEESALAQINNLPSVQRAWERGLGG